MTDPSQDSPRMPPRFVPTLTEVVEVSPPSAFAPAPEPVPMADAREEAEPVVALVTEVPERIHVAEAARLDSEELARQLSARVLQQLRPALEQALSEAVAAAVGEQLRGLEQRVGLAVDAVVRETVARAMSHEAFPSHRS